MKFKSLESLRGIAAIIVALFHSGFVVGEKYPIVAQGGIFVDFFFILSGFVMAYAYGGKIRNGLGFGKFLVLRFGRLYPLHMCLLLMWIPYVLAKAYAFHKLGMGTDPFARDNAYTFLSNVFLMNSMGFHESLSWNYPAWSIGVEFFTYISFFVFIFIVGDKLRSVYFFSVSVFSYLVLYLITDDSLLSTYDFGFVRCLGGFFLGAWVQHSVKDFSLSVSFQSATSLEFFAVSLALVLVFFSGSNKEVQLISFASFAFVIFVFSVQESGALSKFLQYRFMLFLGGLSYSIYMTHAIVFSVAGNVWQYVLRMPVKVVERAGEDAFKYFDIWYADAINVVCLVLVVLLSSVTYKYIESPWRDRFRRYAQRFDAGDPAENTVKKTFDIR